MFARAHGCAVRGITGLMVEVEVDVARGLPSFEIVGLPDPSVRESRERVRAAIRNSGFEFPMGRITVNLAPADVRKVGVGLDLPIAVSILAAVGAVPESRLERATLIGELALDGSVRPVRGVLPAAAAAWQCGLGAALVPPDNAQEAKCIGNLDVLAPGTLCEAVRYLNTGARPALPQRRGHDKESFGAGPDFSCVIGQRSAARALEVAVAGGHNLIMVGSPGGGKTLLASCVPSILPEMSMREAIEVSCVKSVSGSDMAAGIATVRPFRQPHPSVTLVGMLGGGSPPMPGEVTLAHAGVLYLDEFCEFPRPVLESLRSPMEAGVITVSRARAAVTFPSSFMLIASANPCACGNHGDSERRCVCTGVQLARHRRRLCGPLVDRIDIQVEVPRVNWDNLRMCDDRRSSSEIREAVGNARRLQEARYGREGETNSRLGANEIERKAHLRAEAHATLVEAVRTMRLSVRTYHRLIKVARTIADLDGSESIAEEHALEALQYRMLEPAIGCAGAEVDPDD
ncbi:MAG: YifB family Mg chelatase-like AAA ATPase [Clostridia bacterium]|nr:YifB family Mg chelatase-like AAA ATPase [Clostridia bacterium]